MKKNLIIIIVLVGVGIVAYYGFIKDTPIANSFLTSQPTGDTSGVLGRDISDALNKINTLRVDTSIFQNPNFQILRDYSSRIDPENRGRENPFLKIVPGAKGTTDDIVVDSLNPNATTTEPATTGAPTATPPTTAPKTTGSTTTPPAATPATVSGSGSGSASVQGSD